MDMNDAQIRGWFAAAPQQTKIATALLGKALRPREIATVSGVAYGSVRELLSRMRRRGFVVRDARGVYRLAAAVQSALEGEDA